MAVVSRAALVGYTSQDSTVRKDAGWVNVDTAAGTAHTNSKTETAVASHTFAGGQLRSGDIIEYECIVRATATNSTDTLDLNVYFGGTALNTKIVNPSAAPHDVANDDIWWVKGTITIRDADSSGTHVSMATCYDEPVQTGLATQPVFEQHYLITSSVDFTSDLFLEVGALWSAASTGNSCQTEIWNVKIITRG